MLNLNGLKNNGWVVTEGHEINTPELLFRKIEDFEIQSQINNLKQFKK